MAKGYFEIWKDSVTGWVSDPRGSAEVTLFIAGQPVRTIVAHEHRPDVEAVGAGGSYCGFRFDLVPGASLDVLISNTAVQAKLPGGEVFDVPPANGILEARRDMSERSLEQQETQALLDERKKVAPGSSGWLFLVNDRNHSMEQVNGSIPPSAADISAWKVLLNIRKAVCETAGSIYLPAIIPDKYAICGHQSIPPCLPSPHRLACQLDGLSGVTYLSHLLHSLEADGYSTFFMEDTHINDFGSLEIALWARGKIPGGVIGEFDVVAYDLIGDLGEKMDCPKPETVIGLRPTVRNAVLVNSVLTDSGSEVREYRAEAPGHVMLVATSAASLLEGFITEMFGRTTVCITSEFPGSLVTSLKPDLVLNLISERTMATVPNDCFFIEEGKPLDVKDSRFDRYLRRWEEALPVSLLGTNG